MYYAPYSLFSVQIVKKEIANDEQEKIRVHFGCQWFHELDIFEPMDSYHCENE